MSRRGIVLAGGGTGGHIFPAIAVLEILRDREEGVEPLFLCSEREIDASILASRGLPFRPIPAAPLVASPSGLARFMWCWGGSVRASREALREMRDRCDRVTVLATGGFVAAPIAQAARVESVPLILLNQDAPPGKANRWIARHASEIFTTAHDPATGWTPIPPVVRREARAPGDASECRARLGLSREQRLLLVTGASQGARSINQLLQGCLARPDHPIRQGWQVIHQTGAADNEALREAYADAGVPALVERFFDSMGLCWGAADCALSRAGAGLVAEAWANRVPTLFLPYPFHRDQHQRRNAEPLVNAGAARVETDGITPERNGHAADALADLLRDEARRDRMRAAFGSLGPADGAERLAAALIG